MLESFYASIKNLIVFYCIEFNLLEATVFFVKWQSTSHFFVCANADKHRKTIRFSSCLTNSQSSILTSILSRSSRLIRDISLYLIAAKTGVLACESIAMGGSSQGLRNVTIFNLFLKHIFFNFQLFL